MELFNVYWTDMSGNSNNEMYNGTSSQVLAAISRLTQGPAARAGIVKSVIVTDKLDFTCYLWESGKVIIPVHSVLRKGNQL